MTPEFDPGPVAEPFATLTREFPGADVYPADSFRVEWGPIFHRGRLDGSARLLVIGQDPAASETIVRRILVGAAGHRTQGLIAKLGIDRSYLLVNTFLYSVYGQRGGEKHATDEGIAAYRNRWLDAIFASNEIEAVVALGHLADAAWQVWRGTTNGERHSPAYQHVTHPTQPESSSGGDAAKLAAAIEALLANWNEALGLLSPLSRPDHKVPLIPYGTSFQPQDLVAIPARDMPAGLPEWMRSPQGWAVRAGANAAAKRRNITVTIPQDVVPPTGEG
jgi:hypothetical protein